MLIDFHQSGLPAKFSADVLIVGAGAVGLSMAIDLVRRGAQVIVVEAGSTAVEKKSQEFFESAQWHGYPLEGLHTGRFRALGGTTNAWPGQLVPFDPIVFEKRPWVSDQGWPINRATLDPYYKKAYDLLGLRHLKEDDEVWPALKLPVPNLGEDLDVFLTRWTPEPNFAVLFKQEITHHPRLHVIVNAAVTGLSLSDNAQTVRRVQIRHPDGTTHGLGARQVVLANGTVEITRLLSLPLSDGHAAPWADNVWLGRGFVDHVDAYAGSLVPIQARRFHALFDNMMLQGLKYTPKIKLSQSAQRREQLLGIAVQFLFNSQYKEDLDRLKVPVKALLRGKIDRNLLAIPKRMLPVARIALPMAARYLLHRRTYNVADRGIQLRLSSEQIPLQTSRLRLRSDRDSLGMPLVELDWQIQGAELDTMARFCEMVAASLEREKLARIELDPLLTARDPAFLSQIDDGNHQMGMARMASTPAQGVVDADLCVHGSDNLYVAGAATFPTTGFANPTFTAIALGLRLSDHLRCLNNMKMAQLPGSMRATAALGFGCSALSGGSSRRHSIRLVHAAQDVGIQHFDVAPPYGFGSAEDVLGEALKSRRQNVTVATKVGMSRPKHGWAVMPIRSIAAPLRKLVPGLTRRVGASAYKGLAAHTKLEPHRVEASVTDSLRRLRTDYVDLLLLHEVTPDQLTDELMSCLEKLRQKGVVRALGTGTSYESTVAIRTRHPNFFDVWQYSWSVLDIDQQQPVNFTITHRAIQRALAPLRAWIHSDHTRTRRLSDATGIDLSNDENLGRVLIGAAMANNPGGITLVSSHQASRIEGNARLLSDRSFVVAGHQFICALAAEPDILRL